MTNPPRDKKKAIRIIGIDYGLARLGVSVSDETLTIASPLMTLQAEKRSESTAAKLVLELQRHQESHNYTIAEIVIGLPLMMSGKMGFQADEVKHFVEQLKTYSGLPVVTWDERLTTVQAERSMLQGTLTRKRRSQVVDKVAAVIILQSYLDYKKLGGFSSPVE